MISELALGHGAKRLMVVQWHGTAEIRTRFDRVLITLVCFSHPSRCSMDSSAAYSRKFKSPSRIWLSMPKLFSISRNKIPGDG